MWYENQLRFLAARLLVAKYVLTNYHHLISKLTLPLYNYACPQLTGLISNGISCSIVSKIFSTSQFTNQHIFNSASHTLAHLSLTKVVGGGYCLLCSEKEIQVQQG